MVRVRVRLGYTMAIYVVLATPSKHQCAVGIHAMCGMHNVFSYFSLTHSTCCTCAFLLDILSQWPIHKLYYGQQGHNEPCPEKGCLIRRHEVPPY